MFRNALFFFSHCRDLQVMEAGGERGNRGFLRWQGAGCQVRDGGWWHVKLPAHLMPRQVEAQAMGLNPE